MKIVVGIFSLFIFSACHTSKPVQSTEDTKRSNNEEQQNINLLTDSDALQWPLIGIAVNQKGGAVLLYQDQHYWIDGLNSWPESYLNQQVKVWGTLEYRNDAPVFLDTTTVISQGIPVETKEDYRSQAQRLWIVDANYKLVNQ